ncbi:hypothetical protein BN1723_020873 [Verticillium longisporum]|uniref:Uncharacterized protein n=1 Tax=Verticillium longisporum TaxID=100787 RepID=A0A0G4KIE9_VERLO|nr:hypothetical protein BN1723_020873 [Verticillium longisporum]
MRATSSSICLVFSANFTRKTRMLGVSSLLNAKKRQMTCSRSS